MRVVLHYLNPLELAALLKVPTTEYEASIILKRNESLLDDLNAANFNNETGIGCPHCEYVRGGLKGTVFSPVVSGFQCGDCAWAHAIPAGEPNWCCCTSQKFCGVSLRDVDDVVSYGYDLEYLEAPYTDDGMLDVRAFLEAHIEWAFVVEELGGTCDKPWREMTEEEREAWKPPRTRRVVEKLGIEFRNETNGGIR